MEWATLAGTALGAFTTLAGTSWVEHLRTRRDRQTRDVVQKQDTHVAFVLACNASHEELRRIARSSASNADRGSLCRDALWEAGVFAQRERLLVTVSPGVAGMAEAALRRLVVIRDLVGSGETLETDAYKQAYARYAAALWQLRQSMRADAAAPLLDLSDPVFIREQLPSSQEGQRNEG
ncbi:hypothetical protein Snoj_22730 [Streptomyces nojiriensis]|uniref:Secreted protein n=1 Tax=Streptomyces nojiriensis TaxID=66374 RepID=A0ABQ3SKG7_9ACTN|nr:hypothetical protein GCM10010205_59500 [Streptomyces nojiriensis]GHI68355.1 hypothetical protein Snoj_22730 [Streptomyces nojiriensis]